MRPWPADRIERRPIEQLVPYARNARTHSDAQVDQIAASIREWGWTNPVLVSEDGTIIAGHGRVLGARKLGLDEVPVMVASGWTEAQKRAYAIADNKLGLNAGWDEELLTLELGDLEALGFDLDLIGFSEPERLALAGQPNPGLTDPDDVPEKPADPVSQNGDLWTLGRHRLLCGDSTVASEVERALTGCFASPDGDRSALWRGLNPSNFVEAAALGRQIQVATADEFASRLGPVVESIRQSGSTTLRDISAALNQRGIRSLRGGSWHPSSVARLLSRGRLAAVGANPAS